MEKNVKKNFIWNTMGSLLFGFTSLFLLVIITRINGVDLAGAFSYAFAVACIMYCLAQYSGKTFQITETDKEITDSDYLHNRLITFFVMVVISFIFCIVTKQDFLKFILIILLSVYRGIDAYIDSIHATIQRNGYLYKVGMSLFFKTIILVIVFLIVDLLTRNLVLSVALIVGINFIFACFVDYKIAKNMIKRTKFNKGHNKFLFKTGFSLFGYNFLGVYVMNIPKYVINYFSTDEVQTIYSIIIMPASFLSMVAIYIVQPLLGEITDAVNKNNMKVLKETIVKLSLAIIGIGILAIMVSYILGIPLLEFVYDLNLDSQKINLLIIIVGSIFYSLVVMISAVLVAMRENGIQLKILIITAILSTFINIVLINNFEMTGACITYMIIMFFEFICYAMTLAKKIQDNSKLLGVK